METNLITPKATRDILARLGLSDQEFSQIHHLTEIKGADQTVASHVGYLESIQEYQNKESNNFVVGLRLAYLEELEKSGFDRQTAIEKCKEKHHFI